MCEPRGSNILFCSTTTPQIFPTHRLPLLHTHILNFPRQRQYARQRSIDSPRFPVTSPCPVSLEKPPYDSTLTRFVRGLTDSTRIPALEYTDDASPPLSPSALPPEGTACVGNALKARRSASSSLSRAYPSSTRVYTRNSSNCLTSTLRAGDDSSGTGMVLGAEDDYILIRRARGLRGGVGVV